MKAALHKTSQYGLIIPYYNKNAVIAESYALVRKMLIQKGIIPIFADGSIIVECNPPIKKGLPISKKTKVSSWCFRWLKQVRSVPVPASTTNILRKSFHRTRSKTFLNILLHFGIPVCPIKYHINSLPCR